LGELLIVFDKTQQQATELFMVSSHVIPSQGNIPSVVHYDLFRVWKVSFWTTKYPFIYFIKLTTFIHSKPLLLLHHSVSKNHVLRLKKTCYS